MAPLIIVFILMMLLIIPITGLLIRWGFKGVRSGKIKKFLGLLSLGAACLLIIIIGAGIYALFNTDNKEREKFIGEYRFVGNNSGEETRLTIEEDTYAVSNNSLRVCKEGNWDVGLLDDDYAIEFKCKRGVSLGQYFLKGDKLVNMNGEVKFIRTVP